MNTVLLYAFSLYLGFTTAWLTSHGEPTGGGLFAIATVLWIGIAIATVLWIGTADPRFRRKP